MPSPSKLPVECPSGRPATRRKGRGNFTAIGLFAWSLLCYNPAESPGLPSSSKLPVERPSGRPATRRKGRGNFTAVACLNGFYCVTILQNLQGCPHPPSPPLSAPLVGGLHGGKTEVTSQPLACFPGVYCLTILQNLQGCLAIKSHTKGKRIVLLFVIIVDLGHVKDGLWLFVSSVNDCMYQHTCLYVESGKCVYDHSSVLCALW